MKVEGEIMEQSLLPQLSHPRLLRLAGLISVLGAIGAAAADIILQYDPHSHYGTTISLPGVSMPGIFSVSRLFPSR